MVCGTTLRLLSEFFDRAIHIPVDITNCLQQLKQQIESFWSVEPRTRQARSLVTIEFDKYSHMSKNKILFQDWSGSTPELVIFEE